MGETTARVALKAFPLQPELMDQGWWHTSSSKKVATTDVNSTKK